LSEQDKINLLDRLGYREEDLPLDGIRVIDLTRIWAGPFAARHLADLGAEVLRLEHPDSRSRRGTAGDGADGPDAGTLKFGVYPHGQPRPDPWNRGAQFNKMNRNKLSLSIDFAKPGGLDILRRLVAVSDVVIENFSSRVLPNWGLDWHHLREINPRLVYLSMPGFGRTGPWRDYVAVGATIEPHAGLSSLMSYDGKQPFRTQATYSDPLLGVVAAWAIVAALLKRAQSGEGVSIDLAHNEATTRIIGAEILAHQGAAWKPALGNRDNSFVPQGVYPCVGDDEWVAISVDSSDAWSGLCRVLGRADWSHSLELNSVVGRAAIHEEIDAAITAWTKTMPKVEAMEILQAAGVPAGAALTNQDLVESKALSPTFMVPILENWGETVEYPGFPLSGSGLSRKEYHRAPKLGEHNRLILGELLGMTDAEIDGLLAAGTLRVPQNLNILP
jgi:crotonobetainyl-CoA:carnitine CoA-transferase CaiB-like acyl-CoA transferase